MRLKSPPGVIVIGGGVSGLTVACFLLRKGFRVTVIADQFAQETTSMVAGALWEMPHAVCGHHDAGVALQLYEQEQWSRFSYHVFRRLQTVRGAGVHLRRVHFYSEKPLAEDRDSQRKIDCLQRFVLGLQVSVSPERDVRPGVTIRSHYSYLAPMIDMGAYLPWLISQIEALGGVLVSRQLQAEELTNPEPLLARHGAAQLVHCSGLGASTLVADAAVFPVRGAWFAFRNDGSLFPIMDEAHCSSLVAGDEHEHFVFVLPRGCDQLVVGGIANAHVSDLNLPADSALLQAMLQESGAWLPALRGLRPADRIDLRVGLRPFRKGAVRLELDAQGIVHNYGHGGSGVLLSWGCASRVHTLLCRRWGPGSVSGQR